MSDGQQPMSFGSPLGGGHGGAPPPHGPDGPLAHIPFSDVENRTIKLLATCCKIAGIIGVLNAIIGGLQGILTAARVGESAAIATQALVVMFGESAAIATQALVVMFSLCLNGLIAYWLLRSARALGQMVDTDGADQDLLVDALSQLRNLFWLKAILLLIGLAFGLCVILGLVAFGASFPVPNQ